ncbi:kinesin-like protein KIF21A isoform X2 [Condylostylus longicornis]|uniref:kinesin-like protein KIF21A isoform X2 n=1 Tax=Condylostylus longicornis TaxID=2530218 RepID=UPI00244DFC57|nr:kinesin-like protein KIF21A isoform X2 [Condylostylus longicornis]
MSSDGGNEEKDTCVRVAVRIRPQIPREVIDMCRICTTVTPGEPHVVLGTDKAFTFDFVFDVNSSQVEIYEKCIDRLVEGALKGYNATVLAYGQTGSGKTYTMGTGFDRELLDMQEGIIPRAVRHIFSSIDTLQNSNHNIENGVTTDNDGDENIVTSGINNVGAIQFSVGVQFMELYNEDIIDLLDPYNKGRVFKIHEDPSGGISVAGATIKPINGPQDALKCLQQGALARTTASTQMNEQSSRSHALFTILIRRQRVMSVEECGLPEGDLETLTSKFHFVDLAGSERLKRTGATGERAREGISINCGLLALGNVISALGDKSKRSTHVPYRDSKLTRLLQDSLGGNSQTLMIACVSPSDRDFMETLNTLKYANRARNIKNKVQLNQDQSSRTIAQLRREIHALQLELLDYKQGKRGIDADGNPSISDTFQENAMLLADNKRLQQRLKAMQETINSLTERNTELMLQKATQGWSDINGADKSISDMVAGYLAEIETLKAKLIESEGMYQQLKKAQFNSPRKAGDFTNPFANPEALLDLAKREVEKEREILMSRSLPGINNDDSNNSNIENESPESDSDTESDDKTNEIQNELNDLSSDIELKSKLIEQLEMSQHRLQLMRQHYEEKLNILNQRIINTQKERDQVLANMSQSQQSTQSIEKVKKVREEYETKLSHMQRELHKLQLAQKAHLRQQREIQAQEAQLRTLRNELSELKSMKTRLIRKMNEETNRHKEEETRKSREIAQLRKESRKQQNTMKSLQAQVAAKDQILKRKTEQVTALQRRQKGGLSMKASGRVPPKSESKIFNPRQARLKWENLQRTINRTARSKEVLVQLERELERLINERESLSHELANIRSRQRVHKSAELANEEDTLKANLNYVQENISHVQQSIMDCGEGKETENDVQTLQTIIGNIRSVDEAKFILERLTEIAIGQTCDTALTQSKLLEKEALLKEVQAESGIQHQLLQHFLIQNPTVQITDLFDTLNIKNDFGGSNNTLNSNSTYDIPSDVGGNGGGGGGSGINNYDFKNTGVCDLSSNHYSRSRSPSPAPTIDLSSERGGKVRRRTAQPQDLLFGDVDIMQNGDEVMTRSYTQVEGSPRSFIPLARVPSAPGSLKQSNMMSPSFTRKSIEQTTLIGPSAIPQSPRLSRRAYPNKGSPGLIDDENLMNAMTLAQSPPVYRRMLSREESLQQQSQQQQQQQQQQLNQQQQQTNQQLNHGMSTSNISTSGGGGDVFSRLGAGTLDPAPGGSIQKITGKIRVGVPLYCTHTVMGHNNSVLSIKVDENILYTAAADRTVKVWDLHREAPQYCLSSHPGPVIAVQNDKKSNLLFSASGPYVRVWDLRASSSKAIKTLSSSGQILAGNANITGITPGESPITAMCVGNSGNLYVAASDKVRIWDLKSLSCLGKLSGGHQAAVMCVTSWEGSGSTDFVATGSKDHYVKVFEVPSTGGVVYPLLNLEPPHYDGVQALAVAQDALGADAELFSGSRDSGIKRWDLKSGELKQSLNNAHKGWVSGMAISGDVLLSSCRGGIIRLWNVKTCDSLAEMKTESSINDIVASGQRVFTASNDGKVRMWRFTTALRRQCSSIDGAFS